LLAGRRPRDEIRTPLPHPFWADQGLKFISGSRGLGSLTIDIQSPGRNSGRRPHISTLILWSKRPFLQTPWRAGPGHIYIHSGLEAHVVDCRFQNSPPTAHLEAHAVIIHPDSGAQSVGTPRPGIDSVTSSWKGTGDSGVSKEGLRLMRRVPCRNHIFLPTPILAATFSPARR
jgi:hypothetical protein